MPEVRGGGGGGEGTVEAVAGGDLDPHHLLLLLSLLLLHERLVMVGAREVVPEGLVRRIGQLLLLLRQVLLLVVGLNLLLLLLLLQKLLRQGLGYAVLAEVVVVDLGEDGQGGSVLPLFERGDENVKRGRKWGGGSAVGRKGQKWGQKLDAFALRDFPSRNGARERCISTVERLRRKNDARGWSDRSKRGKGMVGHHAVQSESTWKL